LSDICHRAALNHNVVNAIAGDVGEEVRVGDLLRAPLGPARLEQVEQHHQQQGYDHP
jgi:hypothetical protein